MMLNKRGITPVISIILLLMLTISLTGAAWVWMKRIAETQMQKITETNVYLTVTACTPDGDLIVRNEGTANATNVIVYASGAGCKDVEVDIGTVAAGKTKEADTNCSAGAIVRWTVSSDQGAFGPGSQQC